jgi:subtilisin family serine protease
VDGVEQPFYGAAPGAAIVPYRVTDSVIIDHVKDKVGAAIRQAVDGGCGVINISLGALFGSRHLSNALDHAYERGVIVACAAGNIWGEVIYPGRYNRCITMGGVGPGMRPWSGSARGQYVDLCAPSDVIRRVRAQRLPPGTAATGIEPKMDGDGTSYGTALCSGVAALWLAYHGAPNLHSRYAAGGLWQIPRVFKHLLRQTAVRPAHGTPPSTAAASSTRRPCWPPRCRPTVHCHRCSPPLACTTPTTEDRGRTDRLGAHETRPDRILLCHAESSQPDAPDRAGVHQRLRAAGGGVAVGPGYRRGCEQGHPQSVPGGQHAAEDSGPGAGGP